MSAIQFNALPAASKKLQCFAVHVLKNLHSQNFLPHDFNPLDIDTSFLDSFDFDAIKADFKNHTKKNKSLKVLSSPREDLVHAIANAFYHSNQHSLQNSLQYPLQDPLQYPLHTVLLPTYPISQNKKTQAIIAASAFFHTHNTTNIFHEIVQAALPTPKSPKKIELRFINKIPIIYREMETKPEMNIVNNETLTVSKKVKKILIIEEDEPIVEEEIKTQKKVLTEDLGKIFEMAICLLYEIEYDGKYKYSLEDATIIKDKLHKLKVEFPFKIKHIAKNGNKYDFVSIDDDKVNLSAKTTKKDAKVCPQVIGQPSKKKFCEFFGIDLLYNLEQIKNYIETNVKTLLEIYALNTFDCPIVYYNKHKNIILFVKLKESINWTNYNISFSHIIKNKKWNESSCIIINGITIGEFQIHNHRDCIKFRWSFEKLLNLFNDNFEIVDLSL